MLFLSLSLCKAESFLPDIGEVREADEIVTVGRSLVTSAGVITNVHLVEDQARPGVYMYVGDTVYGPGTAEIISDKCVVIFAIDTWISICNSYKTILAQSTNYSRFLYSSTDSVSSPPSSCGFLSYYTQRFFDTLGSESAVERYITSTFRISDAFYRKADIAGSHAYGIHLLSVNHDSRYFTWSDSVDINVQIELLHSLEPSNTCGVVLFDALDYSMSRVGVASLNGACTNFTNGAIVSCGEKCVSTFTAAQILAHEAGHLFGATHTNLYPAERKCGTDIMDAWVAPDLEDFKICSIETFNDFFSSFQWCLTNYDRPTSKSLNIPLIVGCVCGGVGVILLLFCYLYYFPLTTISKNKQVV